MQPEVSIYFFYVCYRELVVSENIFKCNKYLFAICVQINWMKVVIYIWMYLKDFKYVIVKMEYSKYK